MASDHFQGKNVLDHLRDARRKGATASAELHGTEMPGHMAAAADAAKETALALLLLWVVLRELNFPLTSIFLLFSCGWLIWKVGRSALLGWSRLERLHRVIEEERWEIEHHRSQEREELTELYRMKGLSGKLLEEVIDVLMADDDRLLRLMLEEELGLQLEAYEHPLKQSFGAAVGVIVAALLTIVSYNLNPAYGLPAASCVIVVFAALIGAKLEKNRLLPAVIWNLGLALFAAGTTYYLYEAISTLYL